MGIKLFYVFLLSIMPLSELRGGLPLGIIYALENEIPIWIISLTVILLNILLIFFIFYFLDKTHKNLIKINIYKKIFNSYIFSLQKRIKKINEKNEFGKFLSLMLFVAVPLPGTGAWTGCIASWLLGLERKKSILAISMGVLIAGILILLGSFGIMKIFN